MMGAILPAAVARNRSEQRSVPSPSAPASRTAFSLDLRAHRSDIFVSRLLSVVRSIALCSLLMSVSSRS